MSKTNNKISYQTNGILFYIIFTFDRVAQNATNYGSNYEYLKKMKAWISNELLLSIADKRSDMG